MCNKVESQLKHLGIHVRGMSPKPSGQVMVKWLRKAREERASNIRSIDIIDTILAQESVVDYEVIESGLTTEGHFTVIGALNGEGETILAAYRFQLCESEADLMKLVETTSNEEWFPYSDLVD